MRCCVCARQRERPTAMRDLYTNITTFRGPRELLDRINTWIRPAACVGAGMGLRLDFEAMLPTPKELTGGQGDAAAWRLEHWGTAYSSFAADQPIREDGVVEVKFMTVGAPPGALLQAVADAHPGLVIELWADNGKDIVEAVYPNTAVIDRTSGCPGFALRNHPERRSKVIH
jgi:hypothetical protein